MAIKKSSSRFPNTFQMEVVAAYADSGFSFSRAADMLGISQPSASSHVKKLEDFLGFKITDRSGSNCLGATGQGKEVIKHAKSIRKHLEAIRTLSCSRNSSG